MKHLLCLISLLALCSTLPAQNKTVSKNISTNALLEGFNTGANTVGVSATGSFSWATGADFTGDAADFREEIGAKIGTDMQAWSAKLDTLAALSSVSNLTAIANLTSAANKLPYFTGSGTAAVTDFTSFARTLLDDADAATARATLGLTIGTDVQAFDGDLSALAALSGTNTIYYRSGSNTWTAVTMGTGMSFSGGSLASSFDGTLGTVDNAVPRADGTGGKTLQGSDLIVEDVSTSTQNALVISNGHAGQTNSSLVIKPKGTGALIFGEKADGTTTGGNARGSYSVDLQRSRTSASQVVSGNYSFATGIENTVSANKAAIVGGQTNSITAQQGFIGGGNNNSVAAENGAVLGGSGNVISSNAANSAAIGTSNTINGTSSFAAGESNTIAASTASASAFGRQATTLFDYEMAQAGGSISSAGDAVASSVIVTAQTTGASSADMLIPTTGARLVLEDDSTWLFSAFVAARRTDTDNTSAGIILHGCIDRNNGVGTTAIVGTNAVALASRDNASYSCVATADTTNGALKITVTGVAGHTVSWVGKVIIVRVRG